MADQKLSALTELAATPADNDEVYIRDVSEVAAAESKRITIANLLAGAGSATLTVSETQVFSGTSPTGWVDLDLSGTVGAQATLVMLKIYLGNFSDAVAVRKDGDTDEFYSTATADARGAALALTAPIHIVLIVATSDTGVIEWKAAAARASTTVDIIAYIK